MPYKNVVKQKQAQHESYLRNKKEVRCRIKERREASKKWFREEILSKLKCTQCSEADPVCLDFHHIDPKNKLKEVCRLVAEAFSKDIILKEVDKCVVLCSNCHRKYHAKKYQDVT